MNYVECYCIKLTFYFAKTTNPYKQDTITQAHIAQYFPITCQLPIKLVTSVYIAYVFVCMLSWYLEIDLSN